MAALPAGAATPPAADPLLDVQRLREAGQTARAAERIDRILVQNPADPRARFLKGVLLTDQQRDAEAVALFEKLVEDFPELPEPHNNLAVLYAARGDYDRARAALETALRNQPRDAVALENLGDVHAALAAQSYRRALQVAPGSASLNAKLVLVRDLYQAPKRRVVEPPQVP